MRVRRGSAIHGRLAALAGEHEAAHVVFHPEALLDGSVADPLISGDHDEVKGRDDGKPFIIERAPGDLGELDMSRVDNVVVDLAEGLAERQVVLVDEESGGHVGYATSDRSCSSYATAERTSSEVIS